jgi:hypothetical protein
MFRALDTLHSAGSTANDHQFLLDHTSGEWPTIQCDDDWD